jgi:sirohydrochlorin ferrochelatase
MIGLIVWYIVLAIAAFGTGVAIVRYLTAHPLKMDRFLVAALLLAAVVVVAIVLGFSGLLQRSLAVILALAASAGGYWWMTVRFLAREDDRPLPELTRAIGDPGLGHTAVVYFTHGEPETYDPIGWINQFREFDEQGIPFVPLLVRPFFVHRLRHRYLEVGCSRHRQTHARMMRSLEQSYRQAGDQDTRFYLCFLDDNPRPDAAVIEALNDGASAIVVAEVFLTISNHTAEGKSLIDAIDLSAYGVPVTYSGPLWSSDTLQRMFVARANRHLGELQQSEVGVLLVGHGQPDEWDREWPTETEQELGFRYKVLERFVEDGYRPDLVGLAWMEFKEPKPAPLVEEYARAGAERLLYFSAAISADALHSQIDVPKLIEQAAVPEGFSMLNLGAWNDDPLVIQAIKERIDACLLRQTM